jgi:hypothetical protein
VSSLVQLNGSARSAPTEIFRINSLGTFSALRLNLSLLHGYVTECSLNVFGSVLCPFIPSESVCRYRLPILRLACVSVFFLLSSPPSSFARLEKKSFASVRCRSACAIGLAIIHVVRNKSLRCRAKKGLGVRCWARCRESR